MKGFIISAVALVGLLAGAWLNMLLIGVLHAEWWSLVPTMSYGTSMVVSSLLMLSGALGQIFKSIIEGASK